MAYSNKLTCFNVVNTENSPITKLIDEIQKAEDEKEKQVVLYDSSEEEESKAFAEKNIGMYMKSGHCYSDIKSFLPQIICLCLVSLWFSDHKMRQASLSTEQKKPIIEMRKSIVADIGYLSLRLKHGLQPSYME